MKSSRTDTSSERPKMIPTKKSTTVKPPSSPQPTTTRSTVKPAASSAGAPRKPRVSSTSADRLSTRSSRATVGLSPSRPAAVIRRTTTPTRKKNQIAPITPKTDQSTAVAVSATVGETPTKMSSERPRVQPVSSVVPQKSPKASLKTPAAHGKAEPPKECKLSNNSKDNATAHETIPTMDENMLVTAASIEVAPVVLENEVEDSTPIDSQDALVIKEIPVISETKPENENHQKTEESSNVKNATSLEHTTKPTSQPISNSSSATAEAHSLITEDMLTTISKEVVKLQEETLRGINRYYMPGLQRKVDLHKDKPTLATMTRFHRLGRLIGILQELTSVVKDLNTWLGNIQLPEDLIDLAMNSLKRTENSSREMKDLWITLTIAMEAATDPSGKSLEHKTNLFHDQLEGCLAALVDFILPLQRSREVRKSGHLTITPDRLANIELSFPTKFANAND